MSSGFVSGGTTDTPIERDHEWLQAQQEIEATRRRKHEESQQADGKSLYEILQQNKSEYTSLQPTIWPSILNLCSTPAKTRLTC